MQTSYPTSLPVGFAGMQADGVRNDIVSGFNDETVAIPFGLGMVKGTGDRHYKLPSAASEKVDGIGVFTHNVNTIGSTQWPANAGIPAGDLFNVLAKGRLYVLVEEAVGPEDVVYCRFQMGPGGLQAGSFRKTADANAAWAGDTAYTKGQRKVGSNGTSLFECTTSGTSSAAGGATLAGTTTAADSITDGSAKWKYLGEVSGATDATALAVKGAKFVTTATAGGLAQLEFDRIVNLS